MLFRAIARFAGSSLLLLFAACANTGNRSVSTDNDDENRPPMAAAIGKLELVQAQAHEDPRLGVVYRYRGELEMLPDVFVYPVSGEGLQLLVNEGERALLENEYARFRAEMAYAQLQGAYESAEYIQEKYLTERLATNGAPDIPFGNVHAEMVLHEANNEIRHFLWLTEFEGFFVKVQVSHFDYPGLADNFTDFINRLLTHMYREDAQRRLRTIRYGEQEFQQLPGESETEFMGRARKALLNENASNRRAPLRGEI